MVCLSVFNKSFLYMQNSTRRWYLIVNLWIWVSDIAHCVIKQWIYWSLCVHFWISCLNFFYIDDISHNRIATQSHTNNNNYASRAVDGNQATCMQTYAIGVGNSNLHKSVWWKVDLGRDYSIYSINIQFRNYDGYGLWDFFYHLYTW